MQDIRPLHRRDSSDYLASTSNSHHSRPHSGLNSSGPPSPARASSPAFKSPLPSPSHVHPFHPQELNGTQSKLKDNTTGEEHISSELQNLYSSFQKCLELRDKYMSVSRQRLEDNPLNYDGTFNPARDSTSTSTSLDLAPEELQSANQVPKFNKWEIYPPPIPPHWNVGDGDPFAPSRKHPEPYQPPDFKMSECSIPEAHSFTYQMDTKGVFQVYDHKESEPLYDVPDLKKYFQDLEYVSNMVADGPAKSFAFRRLKYLESKWNMYVLLNEYQELAAMKRVPHRDFYNVRKVDTHVHHSASMNQKHLLRFIKSKMKRSPDDVVIFRDDKHLTLRQVFESLNLTAYDLSIDTLDMHAHQDSFHRFDRFNLKYSPIGESRLREIFLKTDNLIGGTYLAEITKEIFADFHQTKYQMAEYRISIYGKSKDEWDKLAKWIVNNGLFSDNVRWLIQIPRLYDLFKKTGLVNNFEDVLRNIFQPLFEVTKDPASHPELHIFLQRCIGIDCVDDESKPEKRLYRKYPFPRDWNTLQNPPYEYWIYHLYASMASLNNWRHDRGFNTLVLRPHAGEAGDPNHLVAAYLTSHSISHGILLRKLPTLQYLYYLKQIGIAMSPLSNNALFLTYERNPLPSYFRMGMNVSLSTDDPLMFAFTKEPLLEEYSVAAQIYKLSPADMCELARNSVIQSGWEMEIKKHWLGPDFHLPGVDGNDISKTNVPDVRLHHRYTTLMEEREMVWKHSGAPRRPRSASLHKKTIERRPSSRASISSLRHLHLTMAGNAESLGAAAMNLTTPQTFTAADLPSAIDDGDKVESNAK